MPALSPRVRARRRRTEQTEALDRLAASGYGIRLDSETRQLSVILDSDPLLQLAQMRALVSAVESPRRTLVLSARVAGASWSEIGHVLGVTRQAAVQRFGDVDVEAERLVASS